MNPELRQRNVSLLISSCGGDGERGGERRREEEGEREGMRGMDERSEEMRGEIGVWGFLQ